MLNEAKRAKRAEARRQARERFDKEYGEASSSLGEPSPHDSYGIEKHARQQWEQSPAIRAEFSCVEAYTAFRRAEAKGLVRIIGRNRGE